MTTIPVSRPRVTGPLGAFCDRISVPTALHHSLPKPLRQGHGACRGRGNAWNTLQKRASAGTWGRESLPHSKFRTLARPGILDTVCKSGPRRGRRGRESLKHFAKVGLGAATGAENP